MKAYKNILIYCISIFISIGVSAQKKTGSLVDSILLVQDSVSGRDCWVDSYTDTVCYANVPELQASARTKSSVKSITRSFIWFDLDKIPSGANIISSKLSLFGYKSVNEGETSDQGNPNSFKIFRVTSASGFRAITWKKQPSYDSTEFIHLDKRYPKSFNLIDSNLTSMTRKMIKGNNFGLWMKLDTEKVETRVVFASSYNPNKGLRPKLNVKYSLSVSKISGKIKNSSGNPLVNAIVAIKNFDAKHVDSTQISTDNSGGFTYLAKYDSLTIKVIPNNTTDPNELITYYNSPPSKSNPLVFYNNQDTNLIFSTIGSKIKKYTIKGQIKTSNNKSLQFSDVYVWDINTKDSSAFKIDSTLTDSGGNYQFTLLPRNRIYLSVQPDSNIYPYEFKTFFPSQFYLQLKDSQVLNNDFIWNFSTLKTDTFGSNSIAGAYGTLYQCDKCFNSYLPNRKIIITTYNNIPKTIIETDKKGYFKYDGLSQKSRFRMYLDEPMISSDTARNSFRPIIYGFTPGALRAKKLGNIFSLGFDAGIQENPTNNLKSSLYYNIQSSTLEFNNENEYQNMISFIIYDCSGRQMSNSFNTIFNGINVSSLKSGMYILKVQYKNGQGSILKFVR